MRNKPITEDWVPSPQTVTDMLSECPGLDVHYETKQFRDWFLSTGKVYASWDARFRIWCRENYRKNNRRTGHSATSSNDVQNRQSSLTRVANARDSKQDGDNKRLSVIKGD